MKRNPDPVQKPERIKPIAPQELMEQFGDVFASLPGNALKGDNTPVNVFGVLLKRPEIAKLFFPYWGESKTTLNLTIYEQELMILRTAYLYECDYVWGHHVPVMLEEGISQEQIDKVALPIDQGGWSEKDAALLQVTDSLMKNANLDESLWEEVMKHYTPEHVLDMITVASQYLLFNSVNNVFQINLEHDGMPPVPKKS